MKLLLIEDSDRLRQSLTTALTNLGYQVTSAKDGKEGLEYALEQNYSIIVLDLMLPKIDGFTVLQKIRQQKLDSSILILSAKSSVEDKVKGLNMGADDYLSKPFELDELDARIARLARNHEDHHVKLIKFGDLTINIGIKEVQVNEIPIHLTPTEYSLLEYIAINKGRVHSFEKLEAALHVEQKYINKNTIEAHISSLRKKLVKSGIEDLVKTKRGFGYYI